MRNRNRDMAWFISSVCIIQLVSKYPVFAVLAPPRITPSKEELIVRAGAIFTLVCEADEPIEWQLPTFLNDHFQVESDLKSRTYIKDVSLDDSGSGYRYRSSLVLRDPVSMDTGYYACRYKKNDGLNHLYNSHETDQIYVYVQDDNNLVVHPNDPDGYVVLMTEFWRGIIPCKPSHPDVKMSLLHQNVQVYPLADSIWSFDPKEGFSIDEISMDTAGSYSCSASTVEDVLQTTTIDFYVIVQPDTAQAPKPFVNDTLAQHKTVGDHFQLNCSASYSGQTLIHLSWFVPNPEGIDGKRIRVGKQTVNPTEIGGMKYKCSHSMLYVENAQSIDQGNYECRAVDHTNKSESTSVFVRIHQTDMAYVNLSGPSSTSLEVNPRELVTWVIDIDAYPDPVIAWSKDGDENIIRQHSKYTVENGRTRTILTITDLELTDTGVYQIKVSAGDVIRTLNYTLRVIDKPVLISMGSFHNVDEIFVIKCRALSCNSKPAQISFRKCLPNRSCDLEWTEITKNGPNDEVMLRSPKSLIETITMKGRARVSGEYRCTSMCRELSVTQQILVIDPVNGFELTKTVTGNPVVAEPFSLQCGVSLYNFTADVNWFWTSNGTIEQISGSAFLPGMSISYPNKTYSYMESLNWTKMPQSAGGNYTCQATSVDGTSFNKTISVSVRSRRSLLIYNFTKQNLEIEKGNEIFIFCHVDGLPIPRVQWLKDGVNVTDGVIKNSKEGSSLYFQYAKENHTGTYRCQFRNSNETVDQTIVVSVLYAGDDTGIIIGILVAMAAVIILIVILGVKIFKDKKRKAFFRNNQLDMFDKGNPESINPDLPIDEQTELLPYDQRWEFPRERLKLGKQLGAGAFGRVLKGEAIGIDTEPKTTVAVKMIRSHGNMVALKALMSELKIMIHLGSHLNVVNLLGACTKNVFKGDLLVIVEYCCYGNLQNYLIRNRNRFVNQVDDHGYMNPSIGAEQLAEAAAMRGYEVPRSPVGLYPNTSDYNSTAAQSGATCTSFLSMSPTVGGTGPTDMVLDTNGKPMLTSSSSTTSMSHALPWRLNYDGDTRDQSTQLICTRDLLCWSFQIARGMQYLADRKILHGDLAARNVLLADDNIVKIADFGLAREIYRSGNYRKKGEDPLPVKWMALESILDRVFSTQSDVWSFGIVLWEIFSLGKTPYPGMEADEQFFRKLQDGYRMEKPKYATNHVDKVMRMCWLTDPNQRPNFADLEEMLGVQLETSVRRHYIDLNDPYVQANTNRTEDSIDYLSMMGNVNYANIGSAPSSQLNDYVNVAPVTKANNYMVMEPNRDSSVVGEGSEYLCMTSPHAETSAITPTSTENSPQFGFKYSAKSHKAQEEEAVDSVETCPMLNDPVQAFSNPNYTSLTGFKMSELEDASVSLQPPNQTATFNNHYINTPGFIENEENESAHYVVPKNNSSVV